MNKSLLIKLIIAAVLVLGSYIVGYKIIWNKVFLPSEMGQKFQRRMKGDNPEAQILSPEEALSKFTLYPGYKVELYASEQEFPLHSPVAMNFDDQGRLWVANSPVYPHLVPGKRPNDSLIILEDTDEDGKADKHTVFADDLYLPMGFALSQEGAYIVQPPNVILAKDTDNDGVMDRRERVLQGFGTADSHHVISALEWGPDGALYLQEGGFMQSHIETPYGPRRSYNGAVWRYEPRTQRLDLFSSFPYANPWGHAFDAWGQSAICDASGGESYYLGYLSANTWFPEDGKDWTVKVDNPMHFHKRGRPTAGCDFVSSSNFPAEHQGRFMVNQVLGFHGTRWNAIEDHGAGWKSIETDADLIQSSDTNFRPVAMEFGPDGALYILDFYNPIIGHIQYSLRDPRRDKTHGRIWRVYYEGNPLNDPAEIRNANINALLELLKSPNNAVRLHARRKLQQGNAEKIRDALDQWLADLDNENPNLEHQKLEALWVYQGLNLRNITLLKELLAAEDFRARAAAGRVIRFWLDELDEPLTSIRKLVEDPHPRVRLEGIVAAGFVPSADAAGIALIATTQEQDTGMRYALERTLQALAPYGEPIIPDGLNIELPTTRLKNLSVEELMAKTATNSTVKELFSRDNVNLEQVSKTLAIQAELLEKTPAEMAYEWLTQNIASENVGRLLMTVLVNSPDDVLRSMKSALYPYDKSDTLRRRAALAIEARLDNTATPLTERLNEPGGKADAIYINQLIQNDVINQQLSSVALDVLNADRIDDMESLKLALKSVSNSAQYTEKTEALNSYQRGEEKYIKHCSKCHQIDGEGMTGAFPPLVASNWLEAAPERTVKVIINGLKGPIQVNGEEYNSVMAPLGALIDDQSVADIWNFISFSWDNKGRVIDAELVKNMREDRQGMWTQEELDALYPIP